MIQNSLNHRTSKRLDSSPPEVFHASLNRVETPLESVFASENGAGVYEIIVSVLMQSTRSSALQV